MPLPNLHQVAELYSGDLYRFAWSLAGSHEDAEDLVQQTLLRFAQKYESIREQDKVKSWLFTVLHREHIRTRRKTSQYSTIPVETVLASLEHHPVSSAEDYAEDHGSVLVALEHLEENLRSPLVLFYLKEMKYREIAGILDIPLGTVMSRIARAKAALRDALGIQLPTHAI